VFRLWLVKLVPFMGKYVDVTSACCGTCPTCITAAGTAITLDVAANARNSDDE
jgi:hypothetical protein